MKRMCIVWLLLLCMTLSACGADAAVQNMHQSTGGKPPVSMFLGGNGEGSATEPATEAAEVVIVQTQPTTEQITEPTTEPHPYVDSNGIAYTPVEPYPIPIANPNKDIYDAPDGNYVRDFETIGYYTIVEQAEDTHGYTWGRLSTGEGWTMVYQQILPKLEMTFTSGAGAWATSLSLQGTGFFSGDFHDSDMGDGGEDYPYGTCYVCGFDGKFRVTDIDTYACAISLEMTKLETDVQEGKVWIQDGVRYIGSSAYGLAGGKTFVLYTPDTPVNILPRDVHSWCYSIPNYGTLNCYILYCPATGTAFYG